LIVVGVSVGERGKKERAVGRFLGEPISVESSLWRACEASDEVEKEGSGLLLLIS